MDKEDDDLPEDLSGDLSGRVRLRELKISFVSVGHRSTLKGFHDFLLELHKDGAVELSDLPEKRGKKG